MKPACLIGFCPLGYCLYFISENKLLMVSSLTWWSTQQQQSIPACSGPTGRPERWPQPGRRRGSEASALRWSQDSPQTLRLAPPSQQLIGSAASWWIRQKRSGWSQELQLRHDWSDLTPVTWLRTVHLYELMWSNTTAVCLLLSFNSLFIPFTLRRGAEY